MYVSITKRYINSPCHFAVARVVLFSCDSARCVSPWAGFIILAHQIISIRGSQSAVKRQASHSKRTKPLFFISFPLV